MVFTKNDILLESTCMGDIAQISVACDLMMESFVDGSDEDTFEEAGGKVTDLFGNEQRYDKSIKGALISNGIVHDEVIEIIKKYIIEE